MLGQRVNRPKLTKRKKTISMKLTGERLDAMLRLKRTTDSRTMVDVMLMALRFLDYVLIRMKKGWRLQMRNDDMDLTIDIALLPLMYDRPPSDTLIYSRSKDTHPKDEEETAHG